MRFLCEGNHAPANTAIAVVVARSLDTSPAHTRCPAPSPTACSHSHPPSPKDGISVGYPEQAMRRLPRSRSLVIKVFIIQAWDRLWMALLLGLRFVWSWRVASETLPAWPSNWDGLRAAPSSLTPFYCIPLHLYCMAPGPAHIRTCGAATSSSFL